MLDQSFTVYHEAHEGHEERTAELETRPDFNMFSSFFVLFVSSFENTGPDGARWSEIPPLS
jgi:hypothetical protein